MDTQFFTNTFNWLFGVSGGIFFVLVAAVIIDSVTGVLAAFTTRKLSSTIGFTGIARKVMVFALVAIANLIDDYILGHGDAIRMSVILFFIANECFSIFENAIRLGVPVPTRLRQVLKNMSEQSETTTSTEEKGQ